VLKQTVCGQAQLEIVVGLDPGIRLPPDFTGVAAANGREARQACAVNAAVAASRGELLAFLEDDDRWHPRRLEYGVCSLAGFDLVTCNQLEVDPQGRPVQVNDYPTPSGWLLPRAVWERLGPFDESFTFVDSEYLGRMHLRRLRRLHLVEASAPPRAGLANVARYSAIARTTENQPLVLRTVNGGGVMASVSRQETARRRHEEDCRRMLALYGGIPW
jgi:hypothetical protein